MIITINRSPDWALTTLPVGAVINLPASLADPLILAGQAVPTPGAAITHTDPFGSSGGGSGGGSLYLGSVAADTDLTSFTTAGLGAWANVGASAAAYVPYNLKTLPPTSVANWQPLSGTISSGSTFTVEVVEGTTPCYFAVSAPLGDRLTVTIGGVTQAEVIGSGITRFTYYKVADPNGAAAPTSCTVQRTTGSGTTGLYALNGGPSVEVIAPVVQLASRLPRVNTYTRGVNITSPSQRTSAGNQNQKEVRLCRQVFPWPIYIDQIQMPIGFAGVAGGGTGDCAVYGWECGTDGSDPIVGQAPLFAVAGQLITSTGVKTWVPASPILLFGELFVGLVHDCAGGNPGWTENSTAAAPTMYYEFSTVGADIGSPTVIQGTARKWTMAGAYGVGDTWGSGAVTETSTQVPVLHFRRSA